MPYQPVQDIPDIETKAINIKKLDPVMYEALDRTRFALRHRYNFKKKVREESELISILRSQLLLYRSTHQSLRIILAKAYRTKTYSLVPDAASLLREQIEKIYVISLFLEDTSKWVLHYSRSAWRTDYETYLLEREEYGAIERYREFFTRHYPEYLAKTQRVRVGRKTETIVSDFAKRALTHRWTHPGDERPTWFVNAQKKNKRKFKRLRDYIRHYFEFPTPGRAAATIKNKALREFLFRWHKEYSSICEYTHVAFGKIVIPTMSEFKDVDHTERTEINSRKLAEKTVFLSHIAAATSCALVVDAMRNTYGAKSLLRDYWRILYETSLPANVFWNMYIGKILSE